MKKAKKLVTMLIAFMIVICSFLTTYADNDYKLYQKSIVMICADVQFSGTNSGIVFQRSGTGTGFAVGRPGKAVQYIATCNHVVDEPEGVYAIYIDPATDEIVDCEQLEDGAETGYTTTTIDGKLYDVCVDYFTTKATQISALFSNATNDKVALTISQVDKTADVALCKLASDATTRLEALPLQFKEDVEPNTPVVAVGFPGMTTAINSELRLDGTDSSINDGRISKRQRTPSMFDEKVSIDTYQVTCKTSQGMSGGPIISEENNAIVGVIAFSYIDYDQVKADDYAVCIDSLKPLLDAEGVKYSEFSEIGSFIWIIGGIALAVLLIVIIVVIIVSKKKNHYDDDYEDSHDTSNNAQPYNTPSYNTPSYNTPSYNPPPPIDQRIGGGFSPAPTSSGKNYLVCIAGSLAGKKYNVIDSAVIGRDSSRCNVVYSSKEPGISSVHCELRFDGGRFLLKDLGSSYGTFLANGSKLTPNVEVSLNSGDQFWLGTRDNTFEVRY